MKFSVRAVAVIALLLVISIVPVLAQVDCPDIVETALQSVDDICVETGNNQVCYGNVSIQASPQAGVSGFTFERTGDLADIGQLQTLTLGGLNEAEGTWGVALMRVRANIPDTLPGQNVTFLLFGDVVLENAVAEQTILLPVTRTSADVNVRSSPSPDARQIAALIAGQTLTADGRLEDGSWLRVQNPVDDEGNIIASVGWVSTPFVEVNGDINTLPVVNSTDTVVTSGYGPMQAFYFRSGIGDFACAEAPDSGILVQTPDGVEQVNLRVNGVDVQLGSTAYLEAEPDNEMIISTIEGSASITSQGATQIVAAGTRATVGLDANGVANTVPSDPEPYDADALSALPISLLERDIEIADALDSSQIITLGGDLQATMTWDNDADMDLSILEPSGNLIWFANRSSDTGGNLDVDAIPCANNLPSVENISWSENVDIPAGTYTVGVNEFAPCIAGSGNWTLTVLVGGEVAFTEQGVGGQRSITFDYDPETGIDPESITVSDELPVASFFGDSGSGDFGSFDFTNNGNTLDMYDDPSSEDELEIGDTVEGTFPDGSYDAWTFNGSEGQTVSITMTGDFDTYLELYDPNGEQLGYNDDAGSTRMSLISGVVLPSDGTYTIIARPFFETGGGYEITLEEGIVEQEIPTFVAPPTATSSEQGSIEAGETVDAEITFGERHSWTFEGQEGDVVTITMDAEDDGFDTYLELYGPDGTFLISNDDSRNSYNSQIEEFELPNDGTYTIIARSFADAGSGDYELELEIDD